LRARLNTCCSRSVQDLLTVEDEMIGSIGSGA